MHHPISVSACQGLNTGHQINKWANVGFQCEAMHVTKTDWRPILTLPVNSGFEQDITLVMAFFRFELGTYYTNSSINPIRFHGCFYFVMNS